MRHEGVWRSRQFRVHSRFTPKESARFLLYKRLCGVQGLAGHFGVEKIILSLLGIEPSCLCHSLLCLMTILPTNVINFSLALPKTTRIVKKLFCLSAIMYSRNGIQVSFHQYADSAFMNIFLLMHGSNLYSNNCKIDIFVFCSLLMF